MKTDKQAEQAFANLIARKNKEKEGLDLKNALEELSRLRAKQKKFIDKLKKLQETSDACTGKQTISALEVNALIDDYQNEY